MDFLGDFKFFSKSLSDFGYFATAPYWIHGKGEIADIYQVIRDGVPDKGMLSWGPLLKPEELKAVSVYVYSLKGSNPPNPKPPQGEPCSESAD